MTDLNITSFNAVKFSTTTVTVKLGAYIIACGTDRYCIVPEEVFNLLFEEVKP